MTPECRWTVSHATANRVAAALLLLGLTATPVMSASRGQAASPVHPAEPVAKAARGGEPVRPVVVELFTSQGCSSCPPADAVLRSLERNQTVAGALVVPLSEHVDYWNRLGWRDPFSSPRFSERQRTYAEALDIPGLFTPMVVVDGRFVAIGNESGDVRRAIVEAAAAPKIPVAIQVLSDAGSRIVEVSATVGPAEHARGAGETGVWLAITETGLTTDVMGGENLFRRLRHTGVVRHLERLETGRLAAGGDLRWRVARRLRMEPDWKRSNLHAVVFLQDEATAAIVGAATVPIR